MRLYFIRRIVTFFILMLFFSMSFTSCSEKEDLIPVEEIKTTIISKETQMLELWSQGNTVGFSGNYAEDVTYFDDIAASTRLDGINEVRDYLAALEGKVPQHKFEIKDPEVQVYNNVAILTLHYFGSSMNGEPGPPWKATSVYHLRDGEWQVVHAHWSLIKEPKAAEPD